MSKVALRAFGRMVYAIGISLSVYFMLEPGEQLVVATIGGFCVGCGSFMISIGEEI